MQKKLTIALTHMRHAMTGGTERYLNYLATYLCEKGHDVTIICRSHEEKPHPNVKFIKLRPLAINRTQRYNTFAKALEVYLKTHSFDVVYGLGRTWTQDVVRLGGGCYQTFLDRAHYMTHSKMEDYLNLGFLTHKAKLALEKKTMSAQGTQKIICNSYMVKRDVMQRYGVPEEKLVVIHNGTDIEKFNSANYKIEAKEFRVQNGIAENELVFLFLGTGYKRKGLDLVLQAYAKYVNQDYKSKLVVAGYDSGAKEFETLAAKLGIADSTIFLGGRRDPEVLYAAANIYLLPTRDDPFANSTVEALASGLPVITSENNGGSELIENFKTGSVIRMDGNEVNEIFNAMCYWSEESNLECGRGEARQVAGKNEINEKMRLTVDLLLAVYKEKEASSAI